jgi:hypothetical protein
MSCAYEILECVENGSGLRGRVSIGGGVSECLTASLFGALSVTLSIMWRTGAALVVRLASREREQLCRYGLRVDNDSGVGATVCIWSAPLECFCACRR